jgi:hypothetical protein
LGQLFSPMFKETLGATCQKMAEILKMVKWTSTNMSALLGPTLQAWMWV